MSKSKSKKPKTIDMTALLLNSKDKLGRHNEFVRTGCGVWKSEKTYSRKKKHKHKEV